MQSESSLSAHLRILASRLDARLFRNQVGHYTIQGGRKITTGLGVGSPDLVGWKTVEITPDLVGRRLAIFVGIEVKTGKRKLSPKQAAWIKAIGEAGGISAVARETGDAMDILSLEGARNCLRGRGK